MTRYSLFVPGSSTTILLLWCSCWHAVACLAGPPAESAAGSQPAPLTVSEISAIQFGQDEARKWRPYPVTLEPAKWIWLPSERTLPNTFVLFRKEVTLDELPESAVGWITADSRYQLTVNGRRVQWGPAPCDPRQWDVDPVDMTDLLRVGKNVIAVEVLYYGIGEGTWAAGKPGLLLHAVIRTRDNKTTPVLSDSSWQCSVDRAHRPSQPKRWFLRSLQEELDARQHPQGWNMPDFHPDSSWVAAMQLDCPADKPPSCSSYQTTDSIDRVSAENGSLRARQIPLVREEPVPIKSLRDQGRVKWKRDPADWFDFRVPDSFAISREIVATESSAGSWQLPPSSDNEGVFLTFDLHEQIVGFPYFEITAPAGTIVELMTQEAHDPDKTAWMDNHFYSWTRFICRGGRNQFAAFDYDSLRWIQLHIRDAKGPVAIRNVGVLRRQFDWPHKPLVRCSDPALQRLFDASINTLRNSAIETVVDGNGRERQQYSGDGGHQLIAIRQVFGEPRLSRRFLRTFSEGMTTDGYFLDCWPAYDRLARIAQKQVDAAYWGPLLDHGIGFNFDCWKHYLETGDRDALVEPYPRLVRFAQYLRRLRGENGLLPVEHLGIPTVWIDHDAYRQQRHKQCAFNLYAAAMFQQALAPMAEALGEADRAAELRQFGAELLEATRHRFWSDEHQLFVDNLPWLDEEKQIRTSDRALAMSIMFDQCPNGQIAAAVNELVTCPDHMGYSYPCNAPWRFWALAEAGQIDAVLQDLRSRWATMQSVLENNTLQETWVVTPDSRFQWSHCAVAPLFVVAQDIAGIRPTQPGFAHCQIRPQLGDLQQLELDSYTPHGPIHFAASSQEDGRLVRLTIPQGVEAELVVPASQAATIQLPPLTPDTPEGLKRFLLSNNATNEVLLKSKN